MAYRRVHRSNFDRIEKFVLDRVKIRREITLVQLQRILDSGFGVRFFRSPRNISILKDVMEYLLYTKKLIIVNPQQENIERPSFVDDNNNNNNNNNNDIIFNVITKELLTKFEEAFNLKPTNVLAQNICTKFDPFHIAVSRKRIQEQIIPDHFFSNEIRGTGQPISNQKYSGRCWIFACLNVIRVPFMKKYSIKQFEFSHAHIFFWDKIERSNHFLNSIVLAAKKGHTLDSRTVMYLLKCPIEDGGYWNMAVNIIKKHGLMPKFHFPESYSSEDSRELNDILNSKLREFAIVLHDMVKRKATVKQISEEIVRDMCIVYRIVGICLDIPKATFKWYYRSGKNQAFSYKNITPLEFYETVVRPSYDLDNKVSLICDPRETHKFGKLYTLDFIGNVMEAPKILYNNQPIEVLLEACKRSIAALNEPVWYSCEVNQRFSSELGFEDLKIHDIQSIFGTDVSVTMTKSERILYRDSSPTHAMILTGFHGEKDEVTRWRVENSWGVNMNMNGHIMMTTEWFKEYVFEVVVDKKLLPKNVLDVFKQRPLVLPIWDQLGAFSFVN